LKELERENQRLKRIVAVQALDIDILKEVEPGKFLSSTRRWAAVDHLASIFPVSQRRACALFEQPRSTQRLSLVVPCDFEQALRARLREGFGVNHKRVQRLYRDEGLRVRLKNVNMHGWGTPRTRRTS